MINPEFFRKDLKERVDAIKGDVVVSIILYEGPMYYVRDVVNTYDDSVVVNVFHDKRKFPIQQSSSTVVVEDVPAGVHTVALDLDNIREVDVRGMFDVEQIGFARLLDTS